jgi:hypothetical protein
MTANETLLSSNDVRLSTAIGSQTDTAQLTNIIIVTEESLFNAHFGSAFYDTLIADVAVYASVPFTTNIVYTAGSYVVLNGLTYVVLQNTTGLQVPAQNNAFFALAPKFVTPANEFLWQRYMKRLLAFAVANEFTIPSAIKQTEKGVIRLKDENFDAAKSGDLAMLKESNYQHIKQTISVMEAYIMKNEADYPTYKRVADKADSLCNKDEPTARKYRRNTYGIVLPPDDNDLNDCLCHS